jgi:hypothetical protein
MTIHKISQFTYFIQDFVCPQFVICLTDLHIAIEIDHKIFFGSTRDFRLKTNGLLVSVVVEIEFKRMFNVELTI